MSIELTHRLAELSERGKERRRRSLQIQEESCFLLDRTRRLAAWRCDWVVAASGQAESVVTTLPVTPEPQSAVRREEGAHVEGGVLDEVQTLLHEIDVRASEHWDEDDACILHGLEEAWAAAVHKGYTLEDLLTVLRLLSRPQ